jgi:hypothetical protein
MNPIIKTILHHPDPIDPTLWGSIKNFLDFLPLASPIIIIISIISFFFIASILLIVVGIRSRN